MLHNFIRNDALEDADFESDVQDASPHQTQSTTDDTGDDVDMGALRDAIVTAMIS